MTDRMAAMGETEFREIKDPFTGQTVKIRDDLVKRLRGQYAVGPTLQNGEPEFGWRQMGEPSAIHLEAATALEHAAAREAWLKTLLQRARQIIDGDNRSTDKPSSHLFSFVSEIDSALGDSNA